jgi:hypothetical protein
VTRDLDTSVWDGPRDIDPDVGEQAEELKNHHDRVTRIRRA